MTHEYLDRTWRPASPGAGNGVSDWLRHHLGGLVVMDAQSLTTALRGKWFGRYGTARCPAHEDRHPSLSLANGIDGRLLMTCHAGCSFEDILAALRGLGLIPGLGAFRPIEQICKRQRLAAEQAYEEKRSRRAAELWANAQPVGGTVAETYLRGRGITCDLPPSIRFKAHCRHPSGRHLPALISLIDTIKEDRRAAVHRTYLREDGNGKADAAPSKAMLGPVRGGAVRLSEGPGPLVVTEGIETGLSLLSGLLPGPATVWAALSTSGIQSLCLPPRRGRLIVASDGDQAGRNAADSLARRADGLGWQVDLLPAPDGSDWNDVLCGKEAAS